MFNGKNQFPHMPGIEVEFALQQLAGNADLLKRLMAKFVVNHRRTKEEILSALANDDQESAYRVAHTLKGVAGTVGALEVSEKAGEVTAALKRNENISDLLDELEVVLQQAITSLEQLD